MSHLTLAAERKIGVAEFDADLVRCGSPSMSAAICVEDRVGSRCRCRSSPCANGCHAVAVQSDTGFGRLHRVAANRRGHAHPYKPLRPSWTWAGHRRRACDQPKSAARFFACKEPATRVENGRPSARDPSVGSLLALRSCDGIQCRAATASSSIAHLQRQHDPPPSPGARMAMKMPAGRGRHEPVRSSDRIGAQHRATASLSADVS